MKIIIEYDSIEEANSALRAPELQDKLDQIWEECFRKNRKGWDYTNPILNTEEAYDVIEAIAQIYLDIVND